MVEAVLTPRRSTHGVPHVSRRCGEVEADHVVEDVRTLNPELQTLNPTSEVSSRRCGEVEAGHVVEAVRFLRPRTRLLKHHAVAPQLESESST